MEAQGKAHLKGNGVRGAPSASTGLGPGKQESKAQDELRWLGRRRMCTCASRTGAGTGGKERRRRERFFRHRYGAQCVVDEVPFPLAFQPEIRQALSPPPTEELHCNDPGAITGVQKSIR